MKRISLAIIVFPVYAIFFIAQVNISGKVTDKTTGAAIYPANVFLANTQSGIVTVSLGADHETKQSAGDGRSIANGQVSYLYALESKVKLFIDGQVAQPSLLKEYGHFATERIAELMPINYTIANAPEDQNAPTLNGFTFSDLIIERDQIKGGGPPRDGIPSIDKPVFISSFYAKYLQADNMVLGVEHNGVAKAYPIRILNWHEIVNDSFAGKNVSVTYCPLCGSGMAFNTENIGPLGVSGLLYNSDVLLYDRNTESLWSQILGKAISGTASGQDLEYIPTEFTTWGKWKETHPNTTVLSTNTGYHRDYAKDPYDGYENTEKLMFPVKNKSDILSAKENVIGIEINGLFKAYPYSELSKTNSPFSDEINGETIVIEFDEKANSAIIKSNGEIFPSVRMYWFAWYAFHPETEVYRN